MVDITKYPYFSYNQEIEPLFLPIKNQADVQFLNFLRKFPNDERFAIVVHQEHMVDWHASEFYKHSAFEKSHFEEKSACYLWDHVQHTPYSLAIGEHNLRHHSLAHGFTIVKKYNGYCDFFNFSSSPQNNQINNFYVNNTQLFEDFIRDFYVKMGPTIENLYHYKILFPTSIANATNTTLSLSPRQLDCALLMTEGYTAKEIGRALSLSSRTVEEYIDNLKIKFKAKNRLHLVKRLQHYI